MAIPEPAHHHTCLRRSRVRNRCNDRCQWRTRHSLVHARRQRSSWCNRRPERVGAVLRRTDHNHRGDHGASASTRRHHLDPARRSRLHPVDTGRTGAPVVERVQRGWRKQVPRGRRAGDLANGSDATFGRVVGNGGDWFELVVLEDLDLEGWTFEIWHLEDGLLERSAALEVVTGLGGLPVLAGTIVTISEDIPDDTSFDVAAGDWHINLQANANDDGFYFTPGITRGVCDQQRRHPDRDLRPERRPRRATHRRRNGARRVRQQRRGLQARRPTRQPRSRSTAPSTRTAPVRLGACQTCGPLARQRRIFPRCASCMGDVDCDGAISITDALLIAQYSVGTRTPKPRVARSNQQPKCCFLPPTSTTAGRSMSATRCSSPGARLG